MINAAERFDPRKPPKTVAENVNYAASGLLSGLLPPPEMTISQWAEKNRILTSAASSEPGRWRNDRTPYLVEIMDELSPQSSAEDVVFMKGSQIGGTEVLINTVMYYIKHCPSPIGQFQTTELTAKRFIKQREAPSFSAMGWDSLFSGDEIYLKEYPGGALITGWSNSPSNLRSMPIRIAVNDEISEWAKDCGGQGDPCTLIKKRTENFPRKKRFWNSTPGIEGECRITEKFRLGDQRHYNVPCPHCGTLHVWKWENMVWDRDENGNHLPETVRMRCPACEKEYGEYHKTEMMAHGCWISENENGAYPSFHINALYSPLGWFSWTSAVCEFLEAQNDVNRLKAFTNNVLGEAWDIDGGMQVDKFGLIARKEEYGSEVPDDALILTAGVDTQDNRLEVEIVGWGKGLESWSIEHKILVGDPSLPAVWEALDGVLTAGYTNASGQTMYVAAALCDSAGHKTAEVYRFTAGREWRNVFACIGRDGIGRQIVCRPGKTKKSAAANASLVIVGTDTAKDQLFDWLSKEAPCPGYCHFPEKDDYDDEYFAQLTSEKRVKKWTRGTMHWAYKKTRERNEALDCRIYARAALNLVGVDLDKMAAVGIRYLINVSNSVTVHRERKMISKGVRI